MTLIFFSFVWNSELIKPPEKKMRGCKQRLGFINVISAIRNAGGRGVTSYHCTVLFWIIHFASGQRCTTKHVEVFYLSTRWWVCLSSKLDQRLEKQMELLLHRTALLSRNKKKKQPVSWEWNNSCFSKQSQVRPAQTNDRCNLLRTGLYWVCLCSYKVYLNNWNICSDVLVYVHMSSKMAHCITDRFLAT